MATRKSPAPPANIVLPDGRQLTEAISDLVATKQRPCRIDEFVSYTSASPEDINQALADLVENGRTWDDLLLVPDFDEPEPSPLTSALAAALEEDAVLRPPHATVIPLGHAFVPGKGHAVDWELSPDDECGDCGFLYSDHNPLFGQDPPAPGDMTVTDYDAKGEAIDREVGPKPTAQPTLPGVPAASIWGDYQGHRLSHVQLAFGGGPDAPRDLAGKLKIGDRIHLLVTGYVANNGYQQDKDLIYFGKVRVKLDAVTVPGKRFVEEAETLPTPPELIRKSLVVDLVRRADDLLEDGGILGEDGTARVSGILSDLAHLFDPLPDRSDLAAAAATTEATASA